MELIGNNIMMYIGTGGLLGPLLFISFHLLRPILFLPVMFICISGGILFGTLAGTLYSLIGITLSSILFYGVIKRMPRMLKRLTALKGRLIGQRTEMTTSQIALLRLVPFIHFHLLSLCLIDMTANFKDYMKSSFISNIPLAIVYTSIGQQLSNLSSLHIFSMLSSLLFLIFILRKKEITITWQEFFQVST
ncbi:VTT domain-containing protein [Virgibacillus sp. MSJ-26]|uniref:TVP38/TMEM64 family protein n=1 Tax=Virgibacillus sp. MSJ-26 TaxID=2841522 RepID=UPI001C118B58|nr:VTT domain-containing protein [Virgibacillus sp. MSJ-26]MBU5468075.1 VTT domain-containing protein [Virgibacillus sp. MSJ-26]